MTTTTPSQPQIRDVRLKTNLNHKLGCDQFIHIQIAGKSGITESTEESTIFRFTTNDQSHKPVLAKVHDSIHQKLGELAPIFPWLSHNISRDEFIEKVLKEVPGTTKQTEIVIYFYKAIPE